MAADLVKTIKEQLVQKQMQRDQSFVALQQVEQSANELRQRILVLDGALIQLRELDTFIERSDANI
jgi:hypothetical protein